METLKNLMESFLMVAAVVGALVGGFALMIWLPVQFGWWGVALDVFAFVVVPAWVSAYRFVRDNGRDMIK